MKEFFDIKDKYGIMRERFARRFDGELPTHALCDVMWENRDIERAGIVIFDKDYDKGHDTDFDDAEELFYCFGEQDFLHLTRSDSGEDFQIIDILDLSDKDKGLHMRAEDFGDLRRIPLLQANYVTYHGAAERNYDDIISDAVKKNGWRCRGSQYTPVRLGDPMPDKDMEDIIATSLPEEDERSVHHIQWAHANYFTVCHSEEEYSEKAERLVSMARTRPEWIDWGRDYLYRTYVVEDPLAVQLGRYVKENGRKAYPNVSRWLHDLPLGRPPKSVPTETKVLAAKVELAERGRIRPFAFNLSFETDSPEAAREFVREMNRNLLTCFAAETTCGGNTVRVSVSQDLSLRGYAHGVMEKVREARPSAISYEPFDSVEEADRRRIVTEDGQKADIIDSREWTPARERMYAYPVERKDGTITILPPRHITPEDGENTDHVRSWDRLRFEGQDRLTVKDTERHRTHDIRVSPVIKDGRIEQLFCTADGVRLPSFRLTGEESDRYLPLWKNMSSSEIEYLAEHLIREHLRDDLQEGTEKENIQSPTIKR